jgi:NADH-quinone oxidoreductase subunit A
LEPSSSSLSEVFSMGYQFAAVLAFAAVAVALPFGLLLAFKLIRPSFPTEDKSMIYECGEKPIGQAWFNFNPRFYLVALVFVIFEVDLALTFPVAVVYKDWVAAGTQFAWVAFVELLLFILILMVGLVWVWAHGDLEWVKKLAVIDEGRDADDERPASRAA